MCTCNVRCMHTEVCLHMVPDYTVPQATCGCRQSDSSVNEGSRHHLQNADAKLQRQWRQTNLSFRLFFRILLVVLGRNSFMLPLLPRWPP